MNYTIFDYNSDMQRGWGNIFGGVLQGAGIVVDYLQKEEEYKREIDTKKYTTEYEDKIQEFGNLINDESGFTQRASDVGVTQKTGNKKTAQIGDFILDEYDPSKYQYEKDFWAEQYTRFSDKIKQDILSNVQDSKTRDLLDLNMRTVDQTARINVNQAARLKDLDKFKLEIDTDIQKAIQGKNKQEALDIIKQKYNKAYKAGIISGEEYVKSFTAYDYNLSLGEVTTELDNLNNPDVAISKLKERDKFDYKNYYFLSDTDRKGLVEYFENVKTAIEIETDNNDKKTTNLTFAAIDTDPMTTYEKLNEILPELKGKNKELYKSQIMEQVDPAKNNAYYSQKITEYATIKGFGIDFIDGEINRLKDEWADYAQGKYTGFTKSQTGRNQKANLINDLLKMKESLQTQSAKEVQAQINYYNQNVQEQIKNENLAWQNTMRLHAMNPKYSMEDLQMEILQNATKCENGQSANFIKEITDKRKAVESGIISQDGLAIITDWAKNAKTKPSQETELKLQYVKILMSNVIPDEKSPLGYKDLLTPEQKIDVAKSITSKEMTKQVENYMGDKSKFLWFDLGDDQSGTHQMENFIWGLNNGMLTGHGGDIENYIESLKRAGATPQEIIQFKGNYETFQKLGKEALSEALNEPIDQIGMEFKQGMYQPEFTYKGNNYRIRLYKETDVETAGKHISDNQPNPKLNDENWEVYLPETQTWYYWKPVNMRTTTTIDSPLKANKQLGMTSAFIPLFK